MSSPVHAFYGSGSDLRVLSAPRNLPRFRRATVAPLSAAVPDGKAYKDVPAMLRMTASLRTLAASTLAAAVVWSVPALAAEDLTIKFKASPDPATMAAQQTLVEAWGYANLQFLDQTFNGLDWRSELQVRAWPCHTLGDQATQRSSDRWPRCLPPMWCGPGGSKPESTMKRTNMQAALDKSFRAPDPGGVYTIAEEMIAKLGQPALQLAGPELLMLCTSSV